MSFKVNELSEADLKIKLVELLYQTYTLVCWPDSQALMEKEWFEEEAILEVEGEFGSAAYFVPTYRLYED